MSGRRRKNQADKSKRGRHKKHRSTEVRTWLERTTCPEPPSWMDEETARKLAVLRREVDPLQ